MIIPNRIMAIHRHFGFSLWSVKPQRFSVSWSFVEDIHVSAEGVTKFLKGLNPSKAFGFDELHPRVLKDLASELGPVFAPLFQQSIDTGEIPRNGHTQTYRPYLYLFSNIF